MKKWFSVFARTTATLAGHPISFLLAVLVIVIWAMLGPLTHYSSNWQLWINTGTTILTFLMVFLLQHTQNHDTRALHVKLDELIRAMHGARNELIDLEELSEDEIARYCAEFKRLHERYAAEISHRTGNKGRAGSPRPPS